MTLQQLIDDIKELCLAHDQIVSFQVGNDFDIATSKSSERYPAVWFELPVLTSYFDRRRKQHSVTLNFLTLAKSDDISDQMYKTSDMEIIADQMQQAIDDHFQNIGIESVTGLSLRNFTDDDLVGIRMEMVFTIGRECDYKNSFKTVI